MITQRGRGKNHKCNSIYLAIGDQCFKIVNYLFVFKPNVLVHEPIQLIFWLDHS